MTGKLWHVTKTELFEVRAETRQQAELLIQQGKGVSLGNPKFSTIPRPLIRSK